ncbi:MAG: redoxin domain-containing protein [bacterium]
MRMRVRSLSLFAAALLAVGLFGGAAFQQDSPYYLTPGSEAPSFEGVTDDGAEVSLEAMLEEGPVFLVFWKESCPHNPRAMPSFNALKEGYGEEVQLLGVVRAAPEDTKDWAEQFDAAFPLLPDPEEKVILDYRTAFSIATFQIGQDGKIAKVFEGYGQDELKALNQAMAGAAGTAPIELDMSRIPSRQTWG